MHAISLAVLLSAALHAAASNVSTNAHFGKHNACCLGENVHNATKRGCEDGSHRITCKTKYFLDPHEFEDDAFNSTDKGVQVSDRLIENGKFCHVNLLPANQSETRLVVLVCHEEDASFLYSGTLFLVKGILSMVSVVFILATLYVYYLIPGLRETQDKATCWALVCLLLFLFLLGLVQLATDVLGGFCTVAATLVYFFTIAYFSWLTVIMWNVWKTSIMHKWKITERVWYALNLVYGWTIPVALGAALLVNHSRTFDPHSCGLQAKAAKYYTYVPMAVLLGLNVVLLVWSAWGIHASGMDVSPDARRALAYKFRLYLKLVTLAGVMWIFELLSYMFGPDSSLSFWLIADVLNALHGVGVFLVLVVWRRRIRTELAGKRILGVPTPASWGLEAVGSEEGALYVTDARIGDGGERRTTNNLL